MPNTKAHDYAKAGKIIGFSTCSINKYYSNCSVVVVV